MEEDILDKREEKRLELESTFSYDGYQVVRKELFAHLREPAITIRNDSITFNSACINQLEDTVYVHIMFNQDLKRLVGHLRIYFIKNLVGVNLKDIKC